MSILKPVSCDQWITGNARHAREKGKRSGRYWLVRDYPAGEIPEATNYA